MGEKRKIVVILSVAIFLFVFLLGGNTAFSVNRVDVDFALATDYNYAQAQSAREDVDRECIGKNILFLSENTAKEALEKYPYFALRSFEKKYPNVLRVEIEEKVEVFAFFDGKTYTMTDDEGKVYRTVSSNENVADGGENFLFQGLTAQNGSFSGDEYYAAALLCGQIANRMTGGIRTCFLSLTVEKPTKFDSQTHKFVLRSKEGVELHIFNPNVLTKEKIERAAEKYLSLDDAQKIKGQIIAADDPSDPNGVIVRKI